MCEPESSSGAGGPALGVAIAVIVVLALYAMQAWAALAIAGLIAVAAVSLYVKLRRRHQPGSPAQMQRGSGQWSRLSSTVVNHVTVNNHYQPPTVIVVASQHEAQQHAERERQAIETGRVIPATVDEQQQSWSRR